MLLEKLQNNKGTVSSKLGKELAEEVLKGNESILHDAISLVSYDLHNIKEKNVRAGAAKIIEKVSEKSPEKVAPYLSDLYQAFDVEEPQTRWMLMMTYGYCAKMNIEAAEKAIFYAKSFIVEQSGICLSGAAEIYLGKIGEVSKKLATRVFPILLDAYDIALINEIDWIFEAFIMISDNLSDHDKMEIYKCAEEYNHASKKSTQKRREKLMSMIMHK